MEQGDICYIVWLDPKQKILKPSIARKHKVCGYAFKVCEFYIIGYQQGSEPNRTYAGIQYIYYKPIDDVMSKK